MVETKRPRWRGGQLARDRPGSSGRSPETDGRDGVAVSSESRLKATVAAGAGHKDTLLSQDEVDIVLGVLKISSKTVSAHSPWDAGAPPHAIGILEEQQQEWGMAYS
jgi:hypothetical protein